MNNSKESECVTYIRTGNKMQLNESKTKITKVILERIKSNKLSLTLKDNEAEKNSMDATSYSIYLDILRCIEEETRKLRGEKIKLGKNMKKINKEKSEMAFFILLKKKENKDGIYYSNWIY